MTRAGRTAAISAFALVTALGVVALGPPDRDRTATVTPDDLTAWCARRFGPGDAVFVRGAWNCAHQDSGFFVLSPIGLADVCGEPAMAVGTVTSDNQGINCRGR